MTEAQAIPARLGRLLAAECAAEAAATGTEESDLSQGVWLRWLEQSRAAGPPPDPASWVLAAVRAEAREARSGSPYELPLPQWELDRAHMPHPTEDRLLTAERSRALTGAIGRLPGRCPAVLGALLSRRDPTYPEVARELGISQGSVGPVRSRCLGCLRRMLTAEVAPAELGGMVR
ncbi:sigma-70 family RNA polymerase sigma factor [Streptomyces sp. ODS28]|uniref:RNA polymerase sigma factor n=1 Tax=Streptomyces sp. ODS28 TaxID=3136688 RepID=UPI0031E764A9